MHLFRSSFGTLAQVALPLLICVRIFSIEAAHASVLYDEKTEHFEIRVVGENVQDVREGIRDRRPLSFTEHTLGQTASRMTWSAKLTSGPRGCMFTDPEIRLSIVVTLPSWLTRDLGSESQRSYWECVENTVTIHEHRHVEIWRETANAALSALHQETLTWQPCDDLKQQMKQAFDRHHARGKKRQIDFDAEEQRSDRYRRCIPPRTAVAAGPARSQMPRDQSAGAVSTAHQPDQSSEREQPGTVGPQPTIATAAMTTPVVAGLVLASLLFVCFGVLAAAAMIRRRGAEVLETDGTAPANSAANRPHRQPAVAGAAARQARTPFGRR